MPQREDAKLSPPQEEMKKMALLICDWCGAERELEWSGNIRGIGLSIRPGDGKDIIRAVLTCRRCQRPTIFGMTDNAISFYPTKEAFGQPASKTLPNEVMSLFKDAELCFYGLGFRGAVAMSRACVEAALVLKGITEGDLEDKINVAEQKGILTRTHYMLAHGSRLAGNAALHKAKAVDPSDIPSILSATASIIGHLFP